VTVCKLLMTFKKTCVLVMRYILYHILDEFDRPVEPMLLHSLHTPDSSVVSAGVTNNLCVSPGQILREVAERSNG